MGAPKGVSVGRFTIAARYLLVLAGVAALLISGAALAITDSYPFNSEPNPLAEDASKPRAEGWVGEFLVTRDEWPDWPSCDSFHQPVTDVTESELYFGMEPSERVRRCPDGTVFSINSESDVGDIVRGYFVGEAKVNFPFAAAERVKPLKVAGRPAIVAEPIPSAPGYEGTVGPAELAVLEREPTDAAPGVMLSIHGDDVASMTATAEKIMAEHEVP